MTDCKDMAEFFLEQNWGGPVEEWSDQLYAFDEGEPVLVWVREDRTGNEMPELTVVDDDLRVMKSEICRYLCHFPDFGKCRADVMVVQMLDGGNVRIRHMKGAAEVSL